MYFRAGLVALLSLLSTVAMAQTQSGPAQRQPPKQPEKAADKVAPASGGGADLIKVGLGQLDAKDTQGAMKSFDAAYVGGQADGGFYLGRMMELGLGVPADEEKARVLYMVSADKGSAKSMNRVGLMALRGEGLLQDYKAAREMICKAAGLGEADAQFNCGGLCAQGYGGAKDATEANRWYTKAADQGHIGAINALAAAQRDGLDTPKDLSKAAALFERSANKGNAVGLFELGAMFEAGAPMAKDLIKAHLYYNLSSARRHPQAPEALQRVSAQLRPDEIERAQSEARAWKATP